MNNRHFFLFLFFMTDYWSILYLCDSFPIHLLWTQVTWILALVNSGCLSSIAFIISTGILGPHCSTHSVLRRLYINLWRWYQCASPPTVSSSFSISAASPTYHWKNFQQVLLDGWDVSFTSLTWDTQHRKSASSTSTLIHGWLFLYFHRLALAIIPWNQRSLWLTVSCCWISICCTYWQTRGLVYYHAFQWYHVYPHIHILS